MQRGRFNYLRAPWLPRAHQESLLFSDFMLAARVTNVTASGECGKRIYTPDDGFDELRVKIIFLTVTLCLPCTVVVKNN